MEKQILFNTEMVKAILEGKKTSTRRIIKFPEGMTGRLPEGEFEDNKPFLFYPSGIKRPPYQVGDTLYVRETWLVDSANDANKNMAIDFKAIQDGYHAAEILCDFKPDRYKKFRKFYQKKGWQSSLFMPREAARIFLKVTDVRVERLQDITEEEAKSEGIDDVLPVFTAKELFQAEWNSIYKNWNENPWVWVIEFEKVER